MKFIKSPIQDVVIIEPEIFGDHRGFFMEVWEKNKFSNAGIDKDFVQDNHSKSGKGILRGLHYQITQPQGKLVRAVFGEIFDVAVDLRKTSPTFGRWVGEILSDTNRKMLWVPPGFAHGFYVISESAEVCYKCTDYYAPQFERSLLWNDPELGIDWPLEDKQQPLLSDKDSHGLPLKEAEVFE